jgi:hypothetical protein
MLHATLNGIRLLGYRRRYKYYANGPQCYVTRTLPAVLLLHAHTGVQASQVDIVPFLLKELR